MHIYICTLNKYISICISMNIPVCIYWRSVELYTYIYVYISIYVNVHIFNAMQQR